MIENRESRPAILNLQSSVLMASSFSRVRITSNVPPIGATHVRKNTGQGTSPVAIVERIQRAAIGLWAMSCAEWIVRPSHRA